MGEQIPLSLSLQERASFENFHGLSRHANLALLEDIGSGTGPHMIYLWGPEGVGKSHLLYATCNALEGNRGRSVVLPLRRSQRKNPELLEGMEQYDLVALDDIDAVAGSALWEESLFHLLNRLRDLGSRVVITAQTSPSGLNLDLPDLRSRIGEGVVEHLTPLEDREKWDVLQKRSEARGMVMGDEVASFLMSRTARDFHTLFALLDQLDEQTLVAKRRLTIPFVKELLSL